MNSNFNALKVCLAMIVRDEEQIIERCLSAVKPYIDCWCIIDQGSSDETKKRIKQSLELLPGELLEQSATTFDVARTQLFARAKELGDWVLMLDADEVFQCFLPAIPLPKTADVGRIEVKQKGYHLRQLRLFKSSAHIEFENPVTEQPITGEGGDELLENVSILHRQDGFRHRDLNTSKRDIEILGSIEHSSANSQFALAQAFLRTNEVQRAKSAFSECLKRSEIPNQSWFCHYMLGAIAVNENDIGDAKRHYECCIRLDKDRIDAQIRLAEIELRNKEFDRAVDRCKAIEQSEPPLKADYFEPKNYSYKPQLLLAQAHLKLGKPLQAQLVLSRFAQYKDISSMDQKLINSLMQDIKNLGIGQKRVVENIDEIKTNKADKLDQVKPKKSPKLTIGMATHDDFHGTYFSIISIILYHQEVLDDIEILVIDNNPTSEDGVAVKKLCGRVQNARYIPAVEYQGTTIKGRVVEKAEGEFVLCMDCHVFLHSGAISKLLDYFADHPECNDLIHGPLFYDNHTSFSTHMDPVWRDGFYGTWGSDSRGEDIDAQAFEIPLQGMGMFACRKKAWPGFNARFRGFGGEEGYIHEKFRQRGGRVLCLPFLRWTHRFDRPGGPKYRNRWEDRIRNYLLAWDELGLDSLEVLQHFCTKLKPEEVAEINAQFQVERQSSFWGFDAIYCVADEETNWAEINQIFEQLGIKQIIRRVSDNKHLANELLQSSLAGFETVIAFNAGQIKSIGVKDLLQWGHSLAEVKKWATLPSGQSTLSSGWFDQVAAVCVHRDHIVELSNTLLSSATK